MNLLNTKIAEKYYSLLEKVIVSEYHKEIGHVRNIELRRMVRYDTGKEDFIGEGPPKKFIQRRCGEGVMRLYRRLD